MFYYSGRFELFQRYFLLCILSVFLSTGFAEELDPFEQLHAHDHEQIKVNPPQTKHDIRHAEHPLKRVTAEKGDGKKGENSKVVAVPSSEAKKSNADDSWLKISGRIQVDFRQHNQELAKAGGLEQNKSNIFDMRRARFDVKGKLAPNIRHKFSVELVDSVKVKDAYMDVKLNSGNKLRLGQFTYPYGLENMGSSRYYEFMESSFMGETLSGSRDRGLQLLGEQLDKRLFFTLAIINGTGSKRPDANKNMDYAGQFQLEAFKNKDRRIAFWIGGAYATGKRESSVTDSLEIAPETESTLILFASDLPENMAYTRTRYAADAQLVFGPVYLGGEYLEGDYTISRKAWIKGGYVMGSYFFTGEQRNMEEGFIERQPVNNPVGKGGLGAWEIAFRYSWFNTDASFFIKDSLVNGWEPLDMASNAIRGSAWSFGLNWYPTKKTRMMLNYIRTQAIAADGSIGNLALENVFMARGQIEF